MTNDVAKIRSHAKFIKAAEVLTSEHDRFVEEIVTLTEIPAPPFKEAVRAAAYEKMFHALGLQDVGLDEIGNVTGLRRGTGNGALVVASSHLDTVFPEGTDVTVRREGTKLMAPGVGDDTRGLAALLAFIRALDEAGIETEQDILFVGDVGEEGKGDLRGIRHLFTHGVYKDRIGAFFTFDGIEPDELTVGAVGSYRYRITFTGPGGHSLADFGTVNPAFALGHFLVGMSQLNVPKAPRTTFCASVLQGGTSVNAIPEAVWVEVDLRSEDADVLAQLDADVLSLIETAVVAENTRGTASSGKITADAEKIGNRPAGKTDRNADIVKLCESALETFDFKPVLGASSTDANIPMSLGIPAVKFGHGGSGGNAHRLDEWIDVEPTQSLRGLKAGLLALIATAGFSES
ncbi:M20/M25/M40 family metallo-hydrolase [Roseibium sp.]|uniref:M20/M25/M40 family metallo-hydrolase n=1 Tax=Roseibium sp. TaxID=1936156 RepID=UPI003A978FC8